MYKIAIDAMGGDNGAEPIVLGAISALKNNKNFIAYLYGNEEIITPFLAKANKKIKSRIVIKHCTESIEMGDQATSSLKNKNTSIYKAVQDHKNNEVDGVVSAGHSGATMSLATLLIGRLDNIKRPAIATIMPNIHSKTILLDAGANVDCKPEHLEQFYHLGKEYVKKVYSISKPKIGILSNGEEDSKGNELTKKTFQLLKDDECFAGNVEGNNIFDGSVDVVVCDGFVGNVVLKASEGVASAMKHIAKGYLKKSSLFTKSAAFLLAKVAKKVIKKVDYAEYGGAVLLGVKGCTIIAHGKSNSKAMKNAILQAVEYNNLM